MNNILLLIVIALFGLFFVWQIFNYCRSFKQRYFNAGIQMGTAKTMSAIIEKAKEGKSFKLKNDKDEIKLKLVDYKNKKKINNKK